MCENLTRPFILGADFMSQHYMKLGWVPGKKRTLGYLDETITVASQEVTNEPLILRNSSRIPARNCAVVPVYCVQMFSGKVMAVPCDELRQEFPNIYLELMQMDNTEGKSHDTIPYMIVNLDYHDTVYIKKDTPVAFIHEEDASGTRYLTDYSEALFLMSSYGYYCLLLFRAIITLLISTSLLRLLNCGGNTK